MHAPNPGSEASPPDAAYDLAYTVHSSILGSIHDFESLTIFGAGVPFRLPLSLFQVLAAFAAPRTVRQAFTQLDADLELPEFHDIIVDLVARKLLRPCADDDHAPGFPEVLAPSLLSEPRALDHLAASLRAGRAIVIPDALPAALAEAAYHDLYHSREWRVTEGGHDFFHYRNAIIPQLADQTPALTECNQIFQSTSTRRFLTELSGEDCTGEAVVAAAWYRPGEYALPHDDSATAEPRAVAFIWYLTKHWRSEWGGTLFWSPTGQFILPRFNTLVLFRVTPANIHCVCPVSPAADQKRLTINGFWHRADRSPRVISSSAAEPEASAPFQVL